MTIKIQQSIINILDEARNVERTTTVESYLIYPDAGKVLKNKITGSITAGVVCVNTKKKIANYIEVDE